MSRRDYFSLFAAIRHSGFSDTNRRTAISIAGALSNAQLLFPYSSTFRCSIIQVLLVNSFFLSILQNKMIFFYQDQFVKYYVLLTDFSVSTVTPRGGRTVFPCLMELIQIKRSTVYHLNVKFSVTINTFSIHTDFSGDRAITWGGMVFCEVHSSHCSTCVFSRDINSC